jgi:hypothetical protein
MNEERKLHNYIHNLHAFHDAEMKNKAYSSIGHFPYLAQSMKEIIHLAQNMVQ